MTDYHNPESCNKCKGDNDVIAISFEQGHLSEAKTKCTKCGYEDYWFYGFFENSNKIESNCKTYNFDD